MGKFEKGNPGKPKGAKSEKTLAWEHLGDFITEAGAERVKEILSNCPPDKFMVYYPLLLEYFKPKLARTELKHEGEQTLTVKFIEDGAEDSKS